MSRAQRLLDLIQALRRHRRPVSGQALADELGVSLRTLYRDVASLQGQGAAIEGEAGVGYVLRPGFMLPPLMFSEDEIEALVLGSRMVAGQADEPLADAASNALAKIAAVLPADLRNSLDTSALFAPRRREPAGGGDVATIRRAIRAEHKLRIRYTDRGGTSTSRTVWPFALGYFDRAQMVAAWCELRAGYRHFRTDRIVALDVTGTRYPRRRQVLLKEWREAENIPTG
jgi:predicted DNA-binding transcriptional regulator YafY